MDMRRAVFVVVGVVILALLAAACGASVDDTPITRPTPVLTAAATPEAVVTTEQTPLPTEFRIAYINLMSPVAVDANNPVASDTYDERLDAVIDELKAFKPDLVAFSEATVTKEHGSAKEKLARELKMESQWVRANPYFPGQTKEQNDAIAKQIGFEEGEVILSRSAFPILRADQLWINPRTSETEVRAALHVVVKGPGSLGNVDVYLLHLTGGGEKLRTQQAGAFMTWLGTTHGTGPAIVMGDLSDTPATTTYKVFAGAGLIDLGARTNAPTCCRESVIGEPAPPAERTDYIFVKGFPQVEPALFGNQPHQRPDGSPLYASDHNGLTAIFPIGP